MSKFGSSSNKKEVPQASSNSLSDIVFMLLFFFMVTTQMRETEQKVKVTMPVASEVAKLERKDLSANINIGSPTLQYQAKFGTDARILKYEGVDAEGYPTFSTPKVINGDTKTFVPNKSLGQCWNASIGIKYIFN